MSVTDPVTETVTETVTRIRMTRRLVAPPRRHLLAPPRLPTWHSDRGKRRKLWALQAPLRKPRCASRCASLVAQAPLRKPRCASRCASLVAQVSLRKPRFSEISQEVSPWTTDRNSRSTTHLLGLTPGLPSDTGGGNVIGQRFSRSTSDCRFAMERPCGIPQWPGSGKPGRFGSAN